MDRKARILVVDDAEGVHDMLRMLLETLDMEGVYTLNPTEALQMYEQGGGIDVVLTDIRMEKMDGLSLLTRLKRHDPQAVVILMTALDRKEDILRALRLGAYDFFIKPFKVNEFSESMKRAVAERWRRLETMRTGTTAPAFPAPTKAEKDELARMRTSVEGRLRDVQALESALKEREAQLHAEESALRAQREQWEQQVRDLEKREAELARQQEEFEAQLAQMEGMGETVSPKSGKGGDTGDWEAREAQLAEREALLAEREAYLEQSENALFEKGQRLQELETELDHRYDQAEAAGTGKGKGNASPEALAQLAEQRAALEKERAALDEKADELAAREHDLIKREQVLLKTEALIKAREQYLQTSESILFDKKS